MSSGHHNLRLDEKSLYFMTFVCQFRRYRYKKLPFEAAPTGNRFQRKIDEIFKYMPNVFSTVDYILVTGYKADSRVHDTTVCRVL